MLIRLYSGCRLSQNYDEIFYPKKISNVNVFEAYLATLQYVDIDLDYAYLTRQGVLSFEWDAWADGNVSKYNYMRVSDDELTSYAFITSVNYINGLATVNYAIDIWHTYAPSMTLGDSIMTATRFPRATAPRALPVGYTTNSAPREGFSNLTFKVGAIIQMQYYKLVQQGSGEVSERHIINALLEKYDANDPVMIDDYNTVSDWVLQAVATQSHGGIHEYSTAPTFSFEVKAAWILPEEWITELKNRIDAAQESKWWIMRFGDYDPSTPTPPPEHIFDMYQMTDITAAIGYDIAADPEMIGIGTHTNATPITYNGLDRHVNVTIRATTNDFNVDLEIDGGRNSIEGDFEFDIPIAAASAAETQQAIISRRLKEQQSDARLWQTSFQILASIGQIAVGAGATLTGAGAGLGISQVVSGIGGIGSGIMSAIQAGTERDALNARAFVTNAGTKCTKSPAQNAPRGLCKLYLTPSNTTEAAAAINSNGYTVYYNTNLILPDATAPADATLTTREYDILKYSFARVYGGFPEDVKEALKNILLSGARIWYKIPA